MPSFGEHCCAQCSGHHCRTFSKEPASYCTQIADQLPDSEGRNGISLFPTRPSDRSAWLNSFEKCSMLATTKTRCPTVIFTHTWIAQAHLEHPSVSLKCLEPLRYPYDCTGTAGVESTSLSLTLLQVSIFEPPRALIVVQEVEGDQRLTLQWPQTLQVPLTKECAWNCSWGKYATALRSTLTHSYS